jgi:H+/gluconate symporter-like permease
MRLAGELNIDPALMHRVAVIGAGTLDSLPHNGAVVTLLAVCGSNHQQSYFDIIMVGIISAIIALVAVIGLAACRTYRFVRGVGYHCGIDSSGAGMSA